MLGTNEEKSNKVLCSKNSSSSQEQSSGSSQEQSSGSSEDEGWESVDSGTIIEIKGDSQTSQASGCWSRGTFIKVLLLLILVSAVIVVFPVCKVHKHFPDLLDWIEANKCKGFLTFVVVYALATGETDENQLQ